MERLEQDRELYASLEKETIRQEGNLEMIASENIVSAAVREAVGSILTNKYAEGYPGRRYYGGCEYVDEIENLARNRAMKLFGAQYANVQPHSGSQANMALYFSVLRSGDKIMGMDLAAGGHLTHGAPVSFSGQLLKPVSYGVNRDTELLDYDEIHNIAKREQPKLIIAGASAYSRTIDFAAFEKIAKDVGAYLVVDMAHIAGLVATGEHPNPVPHADFVTSTTHKTLRGPRGGLILIGKDVPNKLGIIAAKSGRIKTYGELVDSAIFPFSQGGPLMHVIAGKAVCFQEAMQPEFVDYQRQVVKNSRELAQSLIAGGLRIVSGGTDNHMCLVDLRPLNNSMTGKMAEEILDKVNITANKNAIPFDTASPFLTSGLRLGTPSLTSRGMREKEMGQVAEYIIDALKNSQNETTLSQIREKILLLTKIFALP
ncbi:MAG: serine hydroxymethyltransferase [Spirochaetia bacterium]